MIVSTVFFEGCEILAFSMPDAKKYNAVVLHLVYNK